MTDTLWRDTVPETMGGPAVGDPATEPVAPVTNVVGSRPAGPPPVPRVIGAWGREDALTLGGAAASSLCTTLLLFGRLTALSGRLGFVMVWFVAFLATYALLVSLTNSLPAVIDKVMATLLAAAAVIAGIALVSVVVFTLWRGREALTHLNFYTETMSDTLPTDSLDSGGIAHALIGTLIIISLSLIFTVPLAIATAVYLNESRGRLTELVRSVVTAMTALPSIIAGLFIYATWVLILGYQRSGLAAALAVSIMMLPIIIRSADVVLRLVPGNLREASAALGAPQWRTVRSVVLPTARSGLTTAVILGIARGIGETAPVLLVSGVTAEWNPNPRENPMMSLPLATFIFVRSPQPAEVARGFATAAVLMILVLILFTLARVAGGRQAGQLSKRQARRASGRSAKDLARIESAVPAVVVADVPTREVPALPAGGTA